MSVRIYRKIANPMQSGRRNADTWLLEHDVPYACRADPLTGWQGSGDPRGAVTLSFPTRDAAVDFARRQGLEFRVFPVDPVPPRVVRSYAANFIGGSVEVSGQPDVVQPPQAPPRRGKSGLGRMLRWL